MYAIVGNYQGEVDYVYLADSYDEAVQSILKLFRKEHPTIVLEDLDIKILKEDGWIGRISGMSHYIMEANYYEHNINN